MDTLTRVQILDEDVFISISDLEKNEINYSSF